MPFTDYLSGFVPPVDLSVLFDASGLLDDPRFWPAFLLGVGGSETAVHAFDVDPADVEEMLDELSRPDSWPVIPIDLSAGGSVHIVFRNFPDDVGTDYVVSGSEFPEPIAVACLDGHFVGPALSWTELVATAQRHTEKLGPAERLLLLLPAGGDADTPPEGLPLVAAALTAVGALSHQDIIAGELLTAHRRFWGARAWREHDGTLVCHGAHSVRKPSNPTENLLALSRAFSAS